MAIALAERDPTEEELDVFRLILSTYQDGTGGQQDTKNPEKTLPGWRDFERAVGFTFGGRAPQGREGKNVFDIVLPATNQPGIYYGLSCKMRGELKKLQRTNQATIELSNSAQQFWNRLTLQGITTGNYKAQAQKVGHTLIDLVKEWHNRESITNNGKVDLTKSSYLVLSWSTSGTYQLHRFRFALPDPRSLQWYFPYAKKKKATTPHGETTEHVFAAHLNGDDSDGQRVFEWYGESGGQLKYYPKASTALWESPLFQLEPLPPSKVQYGLYLRATTYFPQLLEKLTPPPEMKS